MTSFLLSVDLYKNRSGLIWQAVNYCNQNSIHSELKYLRDCLNNKLRYHETIKKSVLILKYLPQ